MYVDENAAKMVLDYLRQKEISKEMTLGDILEAAMRSQYRAARIYSRNKISAIKMIREIALSNNIRNLQSLREAKEFVEGTTTPRLSDCEIKLLNQGLKPLGYEVA